jgi:hypothetical protein
LHTNKKYSLNFIYVADNIDGKSGLKFSALMIS